MSSFNMEDWAYRYKVRLWHFALPFMLIMIGWAIIHTSGILENWFCANTAGGCPNYERLTYGLAGDWFIAVVLVVLALLIAVYMAWAGVLASELDYHFQVTGERITNEEDIHSSYERQPHYDRRWRTWAEQIIAGRNMAGRKWTGPGKMFTRPEYEKRLQDMYRKGVLAYSNGKDERQGYSINGEGGRKYIEDMAKGKKFLHLPGSALPSPTARDVQNGDSVRTHEDTHEEEEAEGEGIYQ